MPNIKIFHLLSDDKNIATMQQPQSLLIPSKSDSQDSSLSPIHQGYQSQIQQNHHQQDQTEEQEQEKVRDESSKKRKREYGDEAFGVEISETPRKSSIRCYDPPEPPRKPKASPATKRRAMWVKRSVVFLDVAKEVESMFPPSVLQDFGKKIKKAIS